MFPRKPANKCSAPYDRCHVTERGYSCRLRHQVYQWESPTKARSLLVGDSIVKFERHLKECDTLSFPGATIQSLTSRILTRELSYENVMVYVGTNNLTSATPVDELMAEYEDLILSIIQRSTYECKVVACFVLPRFDVESVSVNGKGIITLTQRIKDFNNALRKLPLSYEFVEYSKSPASFVSCETKTPKQRQDTNLYARDGLHLAPEGTIQLWRHMTGVLNHLHGSQRPSKELCPEVIYTPSNRHQCSFFTQNSPLSNMYPSPFVLGGVQYTCSEQFIVVSKATLFDDSRTAVAVMHEKDPKVMKGLGKDTVGLDIDMWYANAPELIFPGLMAKYEQNPVCMEFLIATTGKTIAEASPNKQWGTGFTLHSPNLWNRTYWQSRGGKNVMGQLLEAVRENLIGGN